MALKHSITITGTGLVTGNGLVINTGQTTITTKPLYIKVEKIVGGKNSVRATVIYVDSDTKDKIAEKTYEFIPTLDGDNFIRQAYEYIKSLPDFEGSEDC